MPSCTANSTGALASVTAAFVALYHLKVSVVWAVLAGGAVGLLRVFAFG